MCSGDVGDAGIEAKGSGGEGFEPSAAEGLSVLNICFRAIAGLKSHFERRRE